MDVPLNIGVHPFRGDCSCLLFSSAYLLIISTRAGFQSIILNSIFQILTLGADGDLCYLRLARFREAVDKFEEQAVSRNAANKKFLNLIAYRLEKQK